ncbi:unnamed protein product [Cercopithifilaria johnstoni]|uniref:Uncharacterized protein n=1 Tax=Cercopithifilaria johnstoni TaxID=2874296 RepID=A0A8J2M169_9BILA|nr:unnamed protein product [Cercopithifilaria johnstoni]
MIMLPLLLPLSLVTTSSAMNAVIVDLVKFSIFTFLILINISELRCTVIFPSLNTTQLRQSFRILNKTNRMSQFHRKLNSVFTRQKFVNDANTAGLCSLRNCQRNDLIMQKNRELLKIKQENSVSNKLSNDSIQLPMRKVEIGKNKQLPMQLSSLVRSAADMLNLFRRIAIQEQNAQYMKQIIRRKQPMQPISVGTHEFQMGRKSLIASNFDNIPGVTHKRNLRSKTTAEDTTWADLLFGPRGVLTAVFHILDDRRKITGKIRDKIGISKNDNDDSQTTNVYHELDLSLLPDFLIDAKPIDFAKIFEAFLTGSKGNFDERIFNLPEILGICNRLSCGDIYKAIDEFRKSELFINFQTALQLIQDPKGWEILGDLISNPDLIAQIISGVGGDRGNMKNLVGHITRAGKSSKNSGKEIGPEDGDIGIDFSKMIENGRGGEFRKPKKPTSEELPEIAENIDGIDYYNAVESGTDIGGIETIAKPDVVATTETTTISSLTQTRAPHEIPDLDLILPQISEKIDQIGQTRIIIDVTTPIPAKILGRQTVPTLRRLRGPYITVTYKPVTVKRASVHKQAITSTVPVIIRSTTRNFREDSDYYAMYYDDVRG